MLLRLILVWDSLFEVLKKIQLSFIRWLPNSRKRRTKRESGSWRGRGSGDKNKYRRHPPQNKQKKDILVLPPLPPPPCSILKIRIKSFVFVLLRQNSWEQSVRLFSLLRKHFGLPPATLLFPPVAKCEVSLPVVVFFVLLSLKCLSLCWLTQCRYKFHSFTFFPASIFSLPPLHPRSPKKEATTRRIKVPST